MHQWERCAILAILTEQRSGFGVLSGACIAASRHRSSAGRHLISRSSLPQISCHCPFSLQAILQDVGPEGAVYASMGTLCNFGPEEFVAIGQALSALPNLVIWKLAPGDLPSNATVESLNLAGNIKVRNQGPRGLLMIL